MALFRDKTNVKHSQDLLILYLQIGLILLCFLRDGPTIRGSFDTCFKNSRDHLCLFQISFLASSSPLIGEKLFFSSVVLSVEKGFLLIF